MSLAGVSGTIGTLVGLGVTVAALGLVLNFTQRAFDQSPGKRQSRKNPVFDTSLGGGRRSSRRNDNNMFSLPKQSRRNQSSELFNF